MALPSSGAISASQINAELGKASNATFSFGSSNARSLSDIGSGAISLNNFYSKSLWIYYTGNCFPTMTSTSSPAPWTCAGGGGTNGGAVVFDDNLTWQTNVITQGNLNVDKPYGTIWLNGARNGQVIPVYTNFNAGSPCQNVYVYGQRASDGVWVDLCNARGGTGANENTWTGNVATTQVACTAFQWKYIGGGCDGRLGEAEITAWYERKFIPS